MFTTPKPNTLAVSWFYGEFQKTTLQLKPKYQRNPIWSIGQKCFLIDSLISGCPIPQVYINIKTKGEGREKKTLYDVVDGQQRLRAILEFISEDWVLVSTTAKSYPVSKLYKRQIGKRYSELPERLQNAIWDYPLAVQELRGWADKAIRSLFRRLNYVVERLNKQELRHSQYFGEFNAAVEQLTQETFWDDIELFTRHDSQRMKDTEFISELFVLVIAGIQDQQKTLDKFYADNDVNFPQKTRHMSRFRQTIQSLESLGDLFTTTRFAKKADFYGLFAAAARITHQANANVDLSDAIPGLRALSEDLDDEPAALVGIARNYYATVIEGPNKLAKRTRRAEILFNLLTEAIQ
ncbi:MAG: DUF262 domain-containing protein [Candidatus Acidiferrum sp.]